MLHKSSLPGITTAFAAVMLIYVSADRVEAQWPQWGGPDRNFTVDTRGLADSWPDDGPRKIWHRELGDGHSSLVVDDGVAYTMYRANTNEFTVALDTKTGKTLWEHRNSSPYDPRDERDQLCAGPNSTPLIAGDRVFTVGTDSVIYAFHKKTGEVLWKHDFIKEMGGRSYTWGYAASPIAYNHLVIAPVDRPRQNEDYGAPGRTPTGAPTLIALDQATGKVVWKSQDLALCHSSPILINFAGEDQLVQYLNKGIMAVNPNDGALLWYHELQDRYSKDATPIWNGKDLLVLPDGRQTGVLRLTNKAGKTTTEEVWASMKIKFPQNNPVLIGNHLFGSSGGVDGTSMMVAVDVSTGKREWVRRGFALATCVYGDGKLVILDQDGQLGLATATPEELTVHSACQITRRRSWAAPVLVGTTLYVRDQHHVMALDLS